jgi:predicted site-specific integrase-resolvase
MNDLLASKAAKKLGVKTVTVRAWCNQGKFPNAYREESEVCYFPIWRIPESDVENFVKPTRGRPTNNLAEN